LLLAGDASQRQDCQESMQQADCKGQDLGAGAAATSEQGTGANEPRAAPAADLDDLADSRSYAVIDSDVSTHLKVALTSLTTHHICIFFLLSVAQAWVSAGLVHHPC